MKHLNYETLARLVDEAPTGDERRHLEECQTCVHELEALRGQTAQLGRLPDLRPAPGDWEALEARLAAQGLVEAADRPGGARLAVSRRWLRRAAAVALFLGGAASGAAVMAARVEPAQSAGTVVGAETATAPADDPDGALTQVARAERAYIDALVRYRRLIAEQGAEEMAGDPATRYAALEQLVRAGRVAVRQAPADPFLNGLLASALAEQQAVYRIISEDRADQAEWF